MTRKLMTNLQSFKEKIFSCGSSVISSPVCSRQWVIVHSVFNLVGRRAWLDWICSFILWNSHSNPNCAAAWSWHSDTTSSLARGRSFYWPVCLWASEIWTPDGCGTKPSSLIHVDSVLSLAFSCLKSRCKSNTKLCLAEIELIAFQ